MKKFFCKTIFFLAVVSSTAFAFEFRRAKTLDDVYDASCRVNVSNARGSGTFIGVDEKSGKCLILTNFHVVQNFQTATVEFWRDGNPVPLGAANAWKYYDANLPADYVILAVDPDRLAAIDAPYVALGGPDCVPTPSAFFISAGCPKGSHVWSWKGVFRSVAQTAEFQPAPYPGQSGSGLFEYRDGELWYVGTLTWLVGREGDDRAKGAAIPVANLYRAIASKAFRASYVGDSTPFRAPDNYREIAEPVRYSLIEYTLDFDACEPCRKAEADAEAIRAAGVELSVANVSDPDGEKQAIADGVKACPTFVLKNSAGEIVERWTGAGKASDILAKISELFPEPSPEEEPSEIEETLPILFEPEDLEDFRDRAPVRERYNGSFFDDAARLWSERGRKDVEPDSDPAPTPKEEPERGEGSLDETKLADRLGERLGAEIEPIANAIESRIRAELEAKEKTLRKELAAKARVFAWKLVWIFYVAFLVAALTYDSVKAFVRGVWNWSRKFFAAIFAAIDAAQNTLNSGTEEKPKEKEKKKEKTE